MTIPVFNLAVPKAVAGVDDSILDPRNTYADASEWQQRAEELAQLFIGNFEQYTDNSDGKSLVAAGPSL